MIEVARKRLASFPEDGNVRYMLGLNYVFLNLIPEGIAEIKKAADLMPEKAQIRYEAAALAAKHNLFGDEILQEVNRVIKMMPDFKEAYYLMGVIHERRGDARQAVEAWQRAYLLDDEYWAAEAKLRDFISGARKSLSIPSILSQARSLNLPSYSIASLRVISSPEPEQPPPMGETSLAILDSLLPDTAGRMRQMHKEVMDGYQQELVQREEAWQRLEDDPVLLSNICLASREAKKRRQVKRTTETGTLSIAERSAILDQAVQRYQKDGFLLISKTDTTAQLHRPKQFSCCIAVILVFLVIGIILYLLYYLTKKDDTIFLEVDQYGRIYATNA